MVVDNTLVTGESACVLWKVITTSATPPLLLSQLSLIIVTTQTQPKYCGQLTSETRGLVTRSPVIMC